MRPAKILSLAAGVAGLIALVGFRACAKVNSAPAAAASSAADTTAPPGVDISKLDEFQKKVFFRVANSEASLCGQAQSLLASAKASADKGGCRRSLSGLRYVAHLIEQGYTDSEISEAVSKRYRDTTPKAIDVSAAPMKGNPAAKVTLVEFADYECPHCKHLQPVLRQILDEFHNDVKVYFKHYPLPQHTNARLAAEAAVAAQNQQKFWQFQDKLWDKQDELGPAEIEKIAKESGLDVTKFRKDLDSPAVKERVQRDRSDGQKLGLQATPTLYINGREYTDPKDTDSLREWIKEELSK
jgi:protein-disulfide isomerase